MEFALKLEIPEFENTFHSVYLLLIWAINAILKI